MINVDFTSAAFFFTVIAPFFKISEVLRHIMQFHLLDCKVKH